MNRLSIRLALIIGLVAATLDGALQAQPYGLTSRPDMAGYLNDSMPKAAPAISGNWSAVVAFTNLVFTNALGLATVPGTNKLCVWEREGRAYLFDDSPTASQKTLLLGSPAQAGGTRR
jgi:hypothetical protein